MGTDTPIAVLSERPRSAVRLLRAAVRPGDQPAARRDPRRGRHGGRRRRSGPRRTCSTPVPRAAASSRCRSRSSTTTSWPRSSTSTTTASSPASRPMSSRACTASPAAARRCGAALDAICEEVSAAIERGARVIVLCDRNADSVDAPIPSLLLTVGGAPPPGAHQAAHEGRPGRRVRRRPRGASHGAADRVRRRGDQPVPGVRVDRGPHRRGPPRHGRHGPARRRSRTTSRRAARACSR